VARSTLIPHHTPNTTLVFIGFMGSGKTTAAGAAAGALGTIAVDADSVIEQRRRTTIAQIFQDEGEGAFRALEEQVVLELLADPGIGVLSLGGGAILSQAVRDALRSPERRVVWMDVDPETAWQRASGPARPLARNRAHFDALHAEREPIYGELADVVVPANRSLALPEILRALRGLPRSGDARVLWAAGASGDYPVYIGPGLVTRARFWPETVEGRRFVVTDGNVGRLYGDMFEPDGWVSIMPGEQSKTVAHAEIVWTELARRGATREDVIVALGGGVVGDLAGFCAATYQRGVRYVQVPTTVVAQVDSAYGGKTGVDLPEAKNYVGAYHQPAAVIVGTSVLASLPAEELAAGYAEVVKTALLAGGELWERVRDGAEADDHDVIASCALTKLRVVARDERDAGPRQALNLGHTVGHAIETVTGYARYRHGEAVALGLLAALRLSGAGELRDEVRDLLSARGLPVAMEGVDVDAVIAATARDKKRVGTGPVPFVLLERPGAAKTGCAVEPGELRAAVSELAAP
jgi:shikimate kinase/3-dehydroquinate synthase